MKNIGKHFKDDLTLYSDLDTMLHSKRLILVASNNFSKFFLSNVVSLKGMKDNVGRALVDWYYNKYINPQLIKMRAKVNKLK